MIRLFTDPSVEPIIKFRLFIAGIALMLITGIALILFGVLSMGRQVNNLVRYAEISQQRWDALQQANPGINVPELIDGKTPQIIVKEKPEPTPAPTPGPDPSPTVTVAPGGAPKTRTIIRYKKRPTPKPWYEFFKSTR